MTAGSPSARSAARARAWTGAPVASDLLALLSAARWPEAESAARHACQAAPDAPGPWLALGAALQGAGRRCEALEAFSRAAALAPRLFEAHAGLGSALALSGRPREAAQSFEQAARLAPGDATTRLRLAVALRECGECEAADTALDEAVMLEARPGPARALRYESRVACGALEEALADADALAETEPAHAASHVRRAAVLVALRRHRAAWRAARRARQLDPGDPRAALYEAEALAALGRPDAARPALDAARASDDRLDARIAGQLAGQDPDLAPDLAASAYLWTQSLRAGHAALVDGDWSDYPAHVARYEAVAAGSGPPGVRLRDPGLALRAHALPIPEARKATLARAVGEGVARSVRPVQRFADHSPVAGPIRIGLLSPDVREHVNAHSIVPVVEGLARSKFAVHVYALCADDASAVRARIAAASDCFVDLASAGDAEAAAQIRADAVELLIDVAGYTSGARPGILARRPAPVQALFQGYWTTLGGGLADYVITDAHTSPIDRAAWYDEARVFLPGFGWVSRPVHDAPATTRAAHGLADDAVVLGCFSRTSKIAPPIFEAWLDVLAVVPEAVLWLMADTPAVAPNLRREARRRGVSPARLVFAPWSSRADHAARGALADLYVDTWPYGGHTTLVDVLGAGVPAVTLRGEGPYARLGASLLVAAGAEELVTDSLQAYRDCAVRLARDGRARAALRARLSAGVPPALDERRAVAALAAALEAMSSRHRLGLPAQDLVVDPDARVTEHAR